MLYDDKKNILDNQIFQEEYNSSDITVDKFDHDQDQIDSFTDDNESGHKNNSTSSEKENEAKQTGFISRLKGFLSNANHSDESKSQDELAKALEPNTSNLESIMNKLVTQALEKPIEENENQVQSSNELDEFPSDYAGEKNVQLVANEKAKESVQEVESDPQDEVDDEEDLGIQLSRQMNEYIENSIESDELTSLLQESENALNMSSNEEHYEEKPSVETVSYSEIHKEFHLKEDGSEEELEKQYLKENEEDAYQNNSLEDLEKDFPEEKVNIKALENTESIENEVVSQTHTISEKDGLNKKNASVVSGIYRADKDQDLIGFTSLRDFTKSAIQKLEESLETDDSGSEALEANINLDDSYESKLDSQKTTEKALNQKSSA